MEPCRLSRDQQSFLNRAEEFFEAFLNRRFEEAEARGETQEGSDLLKRVLVRALKDVLERHPSLPTSAASSSEEEPQAADSEEPQTSESSSQTLEHVHSAHGFCYRPCTDLRHLRLFKVVHHKAQAVLETHQALHDVPSSSNAMAASSRGFEGDSDKQGSAVNINKFKRASPEPTAVIPEEEAEEIQLAQWVSSVESLIARDRLRATGEHKDGDRDASEPAAGTHVLLTFQRNTAELDKALLGSELAQEMWSRGIDVQPAWGKGAKVFTKCMTPALLSELPLEIGLRSVIVHEMDEHRIWAAVDPLPYEIRPRIKPIVGKMWLPVPGSSSLFKDITSASSSFQQSCSETQIDVPIEVYRTFVHFQMKEPDSPRTKSSTQKHGLPNSRSWVPRCPK